MKRLRLIATLTLLTVGLSACSDERPIESGTWTGFVTPPGMDRIDSSFDVAYNDDSLDVTLSVDGLDEPFRLHNVQAGDSALTFWWEPLMRVDCTLHSDDDGAYRGECLDGRGDVGPIVMAPPGVTPREYREEEAARLEAEKWAERIELDQIDGPRGEMYDVGDTRINALVEGSGPVSVVLISDFGDDLRTWDYVVHEVKEFARVVSYSRSGLGHSEARTAETSFDQVSRELGMLLDEAGVDPPYVLVGHSFGTAFAQAFAASHPDAVAAMVFVDPLHPATGQRFEQLDADSWNTYWNGQKSLYGMMPGPVLSEFELYRSMIEAGRMEGVGDVPDIPVTVISGLRPPEAVRWVGESAEGLEAKAQLHGEMASEFSQSTHIRAEESGRYVHREAPGRVIDAIRGLVERIQTDEMALN